jgi:hypothetical protein
MEVFERKRIRGAVVALWLFEGKVTELPGLNIDGVLGGGRKTYAGF